MKMKLGQGVVLFLLIGLSARADILTLDPGSSITFLPGGQTDGDYFGNFSGQVSTDGFGGVGSTYFPQNTTDEVDVDVGLYLYEIAPGVDQVAFMVDMGGDVDGFSDFDSVGLAASNTGTGFDEGQSQQIGSESVFINFGCNITGGVATGDDWSGDWFVDWSAVTAQNVPEGNSSAALLLLGGAALAICRWNMRD